MTGWVPLLVAVGLLAYLSTRLRRRPVWAPLPGPMCFACGHGTTAHLDSMQKCSCCAQEGLPEPV